MTALAVPTGDITALPVRSVFVFQDVLDAEVPAIYARLRARSLRERARLGLVGARGLRRSAPAGRQHVDPNPVHPGFCEMEEDGKKASIKDAAPF